MTNPALSTSKEDITDSSESKGKVTVTNSEKYINDKN